MNNVNNKYFEFTFKYSHFDSSSYSWLKKDILDAIQSNFKNDMAVVQYSGQTISGISTTPEYVITIKNMFSEGIDYFFAIMCYNSSNQYIYLKHGYIKNGEMISIFNPLIDSNMTITDYITISKLGVNKWAIIIGKCSYYIGRNIISVYPNKIHNGICAKSDNQGRYVGVMIPNIDTKSTYTSEFNYADRSTSSLSIAISTASAQHNTRLFDLIKPISSMSSIPDSMVAEANKSVDIDTTINGMYLSLAIDDLSRKQCRVLTINNKSYLITPSDSKYILPAVFEYEDGYAPEL